MIREADREQSRAELFAQEALGCRREAIKSRLRDRTAVIGIPEEVAASRQGQIGLVTAVNVLARIGELAPNLFLDVPDQVRVQAGVPLVAAGQPLREALLTFMRKLARFQGIQVARDAAGGPARYNTGLFVADVTCDVEHPVTIGADGWLAALNADAAPESIGSRCFNPLGILLAAALGSAELVKQLWLPVADGRVPIEPLRKRTVLSAYDWQVNPDRPTNPALPRFLELGHICVFGLGAIGSGCCYTLGCLPHAQMSLDLVDMDRIEPSNEERLFTSANPVENGGLFKVLHARDFITNLHPGARAFAYPLRFEQYVQGARDRLGYAWCCLDSADLRRTLQTELPSAMVNGGTEKSQWMISIHEFGRPENACLQDLYPQAAPRRFSPELELARRLGIPLGEVIRIAREGRRIDEGTIARALRVRKVGADELRAYVGKRFDQAVAHMCSTMRLGQTLPAATISFVSLLPAVFMVADLVKRRSYGWQLEEGQANVYQCDSLRSVERAWQQNVLAAGNCLCQSEAYMEAFAKRQQLREKYIDVCFQSAAGLEAGLYEPHPQLP